MRLIQRHPELIAALVFASCCLLLQAWRSQVLLATYDQGIFQQVLWNTLHGQLFESTLSSQLSTNVIHAGELPSVDYERLGQHFTPTLLIWAPLLGLIGAAALPIVQVGLVTSAGLLLHRLAAKLVPKRTANWITYAYFCGNALIGPTLGNFTDLCQLPLAVFALMLGLIERRSWLTLVAAGLLPLIREDTGVVLVAIGLWLLLRHRRQWLRAVWLLGWGGGGVVLTTNVLMPLFSDDNAKRFMVENFGQYLEGEASQGSSSLTMVQRALEQPLLLIQELVNPPGQTLLYLLGHSLPFLFIPLISVDTVLLAGPSLLGLFLAQGANDPLSITIRYTFLVVPGFALGALLWWQRRPSPTPEARTRLVWGCCLTLSLLLTLSSNPHRSLSFLIPDSVEPWVHRSIQQQWSHGKAAREALAVIPADASVSANTPLVPLLAQRNVLVRFPYSSAYLNREGQAESVDWVAVDLEMLERYGVAFRSDWRQLRQSRRWLLEHRDSYAARALNDGVVVVERSQDTTPALERALDQYLQRPMPMDPRQVQ
jgi:uncharacterized membrane protein